MDAAIGAEETRDLIYAIMVEDTLYPFPAHIAIGAVRHDGRIFIRDRYLIIKTIRYPTLNLLATTVAAIHRHVKRVMYVIVLSLVT